MAESRWDTQKKGLAKLRIKLRGRVLAGHAQCPGFNLSIAGGGGEKKEEEIFYICLAMVAKPSLLPPLGPSWALLRVSFSPRCFPNHPFRRLRSLGKEK